MPHIEPQLGSFRNKHFPLICGLNPGINRGPAREKIECRSKTQGFFKHPIERYRAGQIIGVIDTHVFHLLIELILDAGRVRQMRNRPARKRGRGFHGAGKEDADVAAERIICGVGLELLPKAKTFRAPGNAMSVKAS